MHRRFRFFPWFLVGALGSLSLVGCGHHHHRHDPEGHSDYIVKKISRKLDLNDAQKEKLVAVQKALLAARNKHREQKQGQWDSLRSNIPGERLDTDALQTMLNGHADTIKGESPQILDKLAEFHASLTAEQKQKLVEHLDKHHKRHHG